MGISSTKPQTGDSLKPSGGAEGKTLGKMSPTNVGTLTFLTYVTPVK